MSHFAPLRLSNNFTALLAWAAQHQIDLDQCETNRNFHPMEITFYHGRLTSESFRRLSEAVGHSWKLGTANWLEATTKLPNSAQLKVCVAGAISTYPARVNVVHTPWDDGLTVKDITGVDFGTRVDG